MIGTILHRRKTSPQWTFENPLLQASELGYEIDTGKFKLGDGIFRWNDLDYFVPTKDIIELIDAEIERMGAGSDVQNVVYVQTTPAATWPIMHGFGRTPHAVTVIVGGEIVDTDTVLDDTYVVLTFAEPTAGEAHIL